MSRYFGLKANKGEGNSLQACRLDFRRSLVSGLPSPRSAGSFPEQRLVIEPSKPVEKEFPFTRSIRVRKLTHIK